MGRFLMYTTLVVLAVFVASTYLILEHGGGTIAKVDEVSLHDLTTNTGTHEGKAITVKDATLEFNDDLNRWEITAPDANFGIEVRNFEDEESLPALEGRSVIVHGIYGTDESGSYINADTVHAAGE